MVREKRRFTILKALQQQKSKSLSGLAVEEVIQKFKKVRYVIRVFRRIVYNFNDFQVSTELMLNVEARKTLLSGAAFCGLLVVLGFIGVQIVCVKGPLIRFKNFLTPNDFSEIYQKFCVNRY